MTAILQPTSPGPFNTTPGPATCRLEKPFSFPQHAPDLDSISLNTVICERSRQPSPVSIFSVASAPLLRDKENLSPLSRSRSRSRNDLCRGRSVSTGSLKIGDSKISGGPRISRNFTCQRLSLIVDQNDCESEEEDETNWSDAIELDGDAVIIGAEHGLCRVLSKPDLPFTPVPSPKDGQDRLTKYRNDKLDTPNHHIKLVTPESDLVSRMRDVRQQSSSKESGNTGSLLASVQQSTHSQRLSDSSSGFVHSMKTASVTNASFSIAPRSSRMRRSTESYLVRGSQNRYSVDSDRPLSNGSSDDAALRRGFKRQQIIDELIATEEAYISDLKALVYLYSTLLASTSSIPNKVRTAIERNVICILHIHENILVRFREARLRAAARRWADTEVPARLGHQRKAHSQHTRRDTNSRESCAHRRVRSSVDSVIEVFDSHPRHSGSAEPIDVFEIISILQDAAKDFYAYEEYCANFEIVGHELQKHSPHLWPTYESGMESLARVIMTIDQRQLNGHRGLTVSDLLIKPIQRLTKYPLLLEQLLNNTPVADAPGTHLRLEIVLRSVRDIVQMVNLARENPYTRHQIQRKWLLQDRLSLSRLSVTPEQFRALGSVELCGILHIAYQTNVAVSGCYALCVIFDEHFLIALPVGTIGKFEAMALIQLCDIKIEPATDGKGKKSKHCRGSND